MNALLIHSDAFALSQLQKRCLQLLPYSTQLYTALSTMEGIQWWIEYPSPDLIFINYALDDGLAWNFLEITHPQVPVYILNAPDQLSPPDDIPLICSSTSSIDQQMLQKLLAIPEQPINDFVVSQLKNYTKKHFVLDVHKRMQHLKVSEIAYFYKRNSFTIIKTIFKQQYVCDYALSVLENILDESTFMKVNRQYIIHKQAVESFQPYIKQRLWLRLQPETDEKVILSKERSALFMEWHAQVHTW